MYGERHIFEIPVYRCSHEQFDAAYDADLASHLQTFETPGGPPLERNIRAMFEGMFWQNYVAPWRFNQVVGWLCLSVRGRGFLGEEWRASGKRYSRVMRKKHFALIGKAFEVYCPSEMTSTAIFQEVVAAVRNFQESSKRKVVLDLDCLESLGPFLDWRRMIDSPSLR